MVPPPGIAAQFAFNFNGTSVFLDSDVRSGGDNGITTHIDPLAQRKVVLNAATIWGFPAESHRISGEGTCSDNPRAKPLLTLPTSCRGRRSSAWKRSVHGRKKTR